MDDAKELLVSVPAWGIFAFLVIKVVLDFLAKRETSKAIADGRAAAVPPTPEAIAAVIRDQQERQDTLEHVRAMSTTQERIATTLEHVAAAQERIAATQDRQTTLIERQAIRTRALAEETASTRRVIDTIQDQVARLDTDADHLFRVTGTERPARKDKS